ncbi:MAG: class I SAM-dependent methyltransferase [Deltaproteobacteria bacterium]|nr:class I SAM-dependent methyltransferase [Deltaproteobacteria bacterium]MBI3391365.1 class I SAM-dependent methyltransferase [Deltaproteobacteria bacterium]
MDESPDGEFYREPRFVTHIDDATIAALTQVYRELIPAGASVLDLMSSWISHLPPEITYARVAGLGMNHAELARNRQLSDFVVHDLNIAPELPCPDTTFDAVINAVSVQYLTRPIEVFASVYRALKPGGFCAVAMSHRLFPTKAIAAWHTLDATDRARLVASYFQLAGGYDAPQFLDRSPVDADPLWIVIARRAR